MEARYQHTISSPLLEEGWLDNFKQQDFCEGAKGLNSLHPVSPPSTLNNASTYDEWMELDETLGCNEFEPFNEVLLPETKDFGPGFFGGLDGTKSLPENIFGINELNISNDLYGTDNLHLDNHSEYNDAPAEKPKITTIKLKKVKVPKKNRSCKNNFHIIKYEGDSFPSEAEGSDPSSLFEKEIEFQAAESLFVNEPFEQEFQAAESLFVNEPFEQENNSDEFDGSLKSEIDKLLSDDYIDLNNYLQEIEEPDINTVPSNLTLKEAITMENADIILDAYLSPDRSSFSLDSPQEQSLNLSFQENILSPENSSQCSYSEGVPSPSSSLGDTQFDTILSTDTQMLLSDDSPMSPCSKNESSTRRGRKPRQKMTPESRYLRKKEQNKQAALRYRAKKKLEDEQLMQTLKEEGERNAKLKKERRNLSQEFKFMKKLMEESLVARNLVTPSPNAFH
ncbi:Cyclic AMP-dependent transcription factor ATF-4 [Armadillidium nasatum]|uniref:Cyclic AMP-dependent transcription factor ATF-4 n=1 Tax=Armadillidium nasatum TaxID=96803 RepID=A0A5N5SYJ5_9CRUS|nr:Cyclic AMP-dependent transcription factor ATF-4 [Armadillidium nasatum]